MDSLIRKLNNTNIDPCAEKITLQTNVEPSQAWFHLTSYDRPNGQKITNFILNKKNFDKYNLYGVVAMGLDYASYPWHHPPICPRNNILNIRVGATLHTGTMPTGYYTNETFVTALNVLFNSMTPPLPAGALTASLSTDLTGRQLVLTSTVAHTFEKVPNLNRDLAEVMGYVNYYGQVIPPSTVSTQQALYYTKRVDIISNVLGQFNSINDEASSNSSPNIVLRIINGSGSTAGYEYDRASGQSGTEFAPRRLDITISPLKWFKWAPQTSITGIDFQIVDEFGDPAYFIGDDSNHNFELVFIMRGLR